MQHNPSSHLMSVPGSYIFYSKLCCIFPYLNSFYYNIFGSRCKVWIRDLHRIYTLYEIVLKLTKHAIPNNIRKSIPPIFFSTSPHNFKEELIFLSLIMFDKLVLIKYFTFCALLHPLFSHSFPPFIHFPFLSISMVSSLSNINVNFLEYEQSWLTIESVEHKRLNFYVKVGARFGRFGTWWKCF